MKTIEILKADSVVNIAIGSEFYRRLQNLSTFLSSSVTSEQLVQEITKMTENLPLTEFGTHFETLLILINEIETKAREQNLIEKVDVPEQQD